MDFGGKGDFFIMGGQEKRKIKKNNLSVCNKLLKKKYLRKVLKKNNIYLYTYL